MEEAGEEQARRAAEWTAENAWEYGSLLRYPSDKQAMTQVPYEPWHFRYVGLPHAWYCWKYNLCLEEYLESLQESGGYQVTLQGRTWYVSYQAQAAQDGVVYIPEGLNYEVSADGCGGYLVTAWN